MQQEPTSVTPPSKKQYLIRGLVYGLVGATLLGLAWYFNSLNTSNVFTTGIASNHTDMNAFGCLSGLIFIAGVIILFIPVVLFQTYRRQLAMASSPGMREEGTRSGKAQTNGEIGAFLDGIGGVIGWIIGWRRFSRVLALAGFVTFVGFFGLARGIMSLNLTSIGVGIALVLFGLLMRVIFGVFA